MIDHKVRAIVSSLSSARGENFFDTIVLALAKAIDAEHAYIATLDDEQSIATTIAYAQQGQIAENFSYELTDTPCADVCTDNICMYNDGVQQAYPKDELLVQMGINSYVGTPLKDKHGEVRAIIIALYSGVIDDIHAVESLFLLFSGLISGELERRHNQQEINIKQTMIDALSEGVLLTNERTEIIYANPAFTTISGYSLNEALGKRPGELLKSGVHDPEFYQAMWEAIENNGVWSGEILNRRKSGETYTEWLVLQRFIEPESQTAHYLGIFHDISDLKYARQQAKQYEYYDLLTELPNRHLLIERIEQQLLLSTQSKHKNALLFISIDNFRVLNNSLGHHIGDKLLQKIAQRIESMSQTGATLARYAGDEFVLLLPMLSNDGTIEVSALRMLDSMRAPFLVEQQVIELTASIGISICPDDATEALDALSKADQACNHAKELGKNNYQFFTSEMQQRSNQKVQLKNALNQALQQQKLETFYQPIVNLKTRSIEKCEALVRWVHEGSFISPMAFIPIAEEFGMAEELGQQVLEQSCQQAIALEQAGFDISIAVNRSVAEFPHSTDSAYDWLKTIKQQGITPSRIGFEITESILAPENSSFTDYLSQLQEAGCKVSLDDFGTGYSSLSYLRNFSIDFLKIDRSFVSDLGADPEALTLVSTIIAMASALGMKTIAEGVETQQQLDILNDLGCDYIQGYFFSRPLPAAEFIQYLEGFNFNDYSKRQS